MAKVPTQKDIRFILKNDWIVLPRYSGENHVVQKDPVPGSYGDFLISRHFYRIIDQKNWVKNNKFDSAVYMRARKIFLKREKKKNKGKLVCENCGKGPLKADSGNIFNNSPMATIDHKIPLSKGGKRFDFDNMACYCQKCNGSKKDKLL